ncbi:MAG: FeoB-associated Cys-rich membrane protein [Paludibacteraceae bacterium]|nr:FeoB-associated Cys-rich membrane protein [Paludibacteraceae bacterium]
MWQEIVSYIIVAIVVLVIIWRQIKRFRRTDENQCDTSACSACKLKDACNKKQ